MATAYDTGARVKRGITGEEVKVIFASSLGTVFEWYDFYLIAVLAPFIGKSFLTPSLNPTTKYILVLLLFAAGFLVRPAGALVFGRLGDMIGRKATFLMTILIMGSCTFLVGLVPDFDSWGTAAPIVVVLLRVLQGLAIGGEYGGAAVYVAEHAPPGRRGFYTSWIQTTASLGLLLALVIILWLRLGMGEDNFGNDLQLGFFGLHGGWRIPFILSAILLIVSVFIRLSLSESPAFQKMKEEGTRSKAPLSEAFGQWANAKYVVIALFGLVVGQAVVWYTGQFYALFFLGSVLKVNFVTSSVLIAWSLILGTPFFLLFGWLSDRIGRRSIILAGCLIAALTYFPLFKSLTSVVNPQLEQAYDTVKIDVKADPASCGSVFDPIGIRVFTAPCDVARRTLALSAFKYTLVPSPAGSPTVISVNGKDVAVDKDLAKNLGDATAAAGYPTATDKNILKVSGMTDVFGNFRAWEAIILLTIMVIYVTMVYGPMAAMLVEYFPTRIRYTAMSLPYHIGNGWFGGFLPATAFAMTAGTGDIYFGLWYPIGFALLTFVIGLLFVRDPGERNIDHTIV